MKKNIFITVVLLMIISPLFSQKFQVKYNFTPREEGQVGYNFFVGKDASLFQTSIQGFGSGFIFDIFSGRGSFDVVTVGWEKANLSLGLGYSIMKYRFQKNLVFDMSTDYHTIYEDPNPDHDYVNTFLGYGKSKLVYGSISTPVYLNLKIGKILFSGGAYLDFYISGKHKRKFIENGNKIVEKIGNSDFRNFGLSKTKLGASVMLKHIPTGIFFSVDRMFTPFFSESYLPEIYEMRVTFGIIKENKYFDKLKKKAKITRQT